MQKFIQVIGWYGVVAIILAFALISFSVVEVKSFWYIFLNITGAIGIMAEAKSKKDNQPFVLNIFWLAIALLGLIIKR
jgi:hypothetical protein